MTKRDRINPRLAKQRRCYTIDEVARLFGVHRNTVRHWIKNGLPTLDAKRPTLIVGEDLTRFLAGRRQQRRKKCGAGTIYCVRCREPRRPAGGMADCVPLTAAVGDLQGLCPVCEAMMHRRVSLARLDAAAGDLDVRFPLASPHVGESAGASENRHFNRASRS